MGMKVMYELPLSDISQTERITVLLPEETHYAKMRGSLTSAMNEVSSVVVVFFLDEVVT